MTPETGSVVLVDADCSVQFTGPRALRVRVMSVDDRTNYPGWVWLTGYVLGPTGQAVDKRQLYVQAAGLKLITPPTATVVAPSRPGRARLRAGR